jgi:hypothetical protein
MFRRRSDDSRLPPNKRLQLTAFGARDHCYFSDILCCAPSAATEPQGVGRLFAVLKWSKSHQE